MPEAMERDLKRRALKKFGSTTSERARRYIYGTMRKTGWKPSHHSKVCPNCGGVNMDASMWCSFCGSSLAGVKSSAKPAPSTAPPF